MAQVRCEGAAGVAQVRLVKKAWTGEPCDPVEISGNLVGLNDSELGPQVGSKIQEPSKNQF